MQCCRFETSKRNRTEQKVCKSTEAHTNSLRGKQSLQKDITTSGRKGVHRDYYQ